MSLHIPEWLLIACGGYVVGRGAKALVKFVRYLDRETRGPFKR